MIRIKNTDKLTSGDLPRIARFFQIVKNRIKMKRIEEKAQEELYSTADYPADSLTEV